MLGFDLKDDFSIDPTLLRSMISGEPVRVERKYQDAIDLHWTAPMAMAGNIIPKFLDPEGAMARRLIVFRHLHPIVKDTKMKQKILNNELFPLLVKMNRAYIYFSKVVGKDDIWKHLPPIFTKNLKDMSSTVEPLAAFLTSDRDLIQEQEKTISNNNNKSPPELFVPLNVFREEFRIFCNQNGLTFKWNLDQVEAILRQFGLERRQIHRRNSKSQYAKDGNFNAIAILGCDIQKYDLQDILVDEPKSNNKDVWDMDNWN
jgi:hypothetical protein